MGVVDEEQEVSSGSSSDCCDFLFLCFPGEDVTRKKRRVRGGGTNRNTGVQACGNQLRGMSYLCCGRSD